MSLASPRLAKVRYLVYSMLYQILSFSHLPMAFGKLTQHRAVTGSILSYLFKGRGSLSVGSLSWDTIMAKLQQGMHFVFYFLFSLKLTWELTLWDTDFCVNVFLFAESNSACLFENMHAAHWFLYSRLIYWFPNWSFATVFLLVRIMCLTKLPAYSFSCVVEGYTTKQGYPGNSYRNWWSLKECFTGCMGFEVTCCCEISGYTQSYSSEQVTLHPSIGSRVGFPKGSY